MRTVSPQNIEVYSRCPRRAFYGWNYAREPMSFHASVIRDVIQAIFLYMAQHEEVPSWKRTLSWIDKYVRQEAVHLESRELYEASKSTLSCLHKWYFSFLLNNYKMMGLTNVPILLELDTKLTYQDEIPFILFGDTMKVGDFKEVSSVARVTKLELYNDIELQIRIWGIYKLFNKKPRNFIRIYISSHTIQAVEIGISDQMLAKTEKMVKYILTGMRNEVWYPSFSTQCLSCPFNKDCTF